MKVAVLLDAKMQASDDSSGRRGVLSFRSEAILLPIVSAVLFGLIFPSLDKHALLCERARAWPERLRIGFEPPSAHTGAITHHAGPEVLTAILAVLVMVEVVRRGYRRLRTWPARLFVAMLCGAATFAACGTAAFMLELFNHCNE